MTLPDSPTRSGSPTLALLGNPNTGKSTIFNALAGVRQRVGNYPGVTVEKHLGKANIKGREVLLVDLPGTYSLAPRSADEMVAVDVLLGRRDDVPTPEILLCIVDASNLERNLYVVSQALELQRPTIVGLNMMDVAAARGIEIDVDQLAKKLGVAVVQMEAHRRVGIEQLRIALAAAAGQASPNRGSPFPAAFCQEVDRLVESAATGGGGELPRFLVERLLLDVGGYLDRTRLPGVSDALRDEVAAARQRLAAAGHQVPGVETTARYGWIDRVLDGVVSQRPQQAPSWSDRLDRILMHKILGTAIFLLLMLLMFQAIFRWALPAMDGIEWVVMQLGRLVSGYLPAGALQSLLVDGVLGGVGGILVFLPQILLLFLFIAILEDCGYMARAAYLADKLMSTIGLSGKSFIPLLSSFACAVPGIMAARVIENRQDRLVTILIAPLMSCSARLPVYVLLIGAFIPPTKYLGGWLGLQAMTMTAMYLVGVVTAVLVALILKRTILREPTPPFVMELPGYKWPSLWTVCQRVVEKGWRFVRQAGTLILAASVVVWALAYYPRASGEGYAKAEAKKRQLEREINATRLLQADFEGVADPSPDRLARLEGELAEVRNELAGLQMRQSFLGRIGRLIEPVVRPLGWDWRIGCAVMASFPAREVVISTLGVIYNLGDDADEAPVRLREKLPSVTWEGTQRPLFNVPVALSIMVFFALCAQCAATLAVIRKETNSWRWPLFTFGYMTTLAYLASLATYQIGMLFLV
jgi:ferrous iron transport protein B